MTTYLVGLVVLAVIVVPAIYAAVVVRMRLLPGWAGAGARLVEATVFLALATAVPAIIGGFGGFRRIPLMIGMVVVCGLLIAFTPSASGPEPRAVVHSTRTEQIAAFSIAALFTGPWLVTMIQSWRFGTTSFDSMNYHLPFAARWFQTGSTWHLVQVTPGLIVPYHPVSAEILNGLGMVAFHSDVLSPVLNLLWLVLVGLAAWCIGAPRGRAPHCMALAVVLADAPFFVSSQAGSAMTDVAVVAASLAAVALVVQGVSMRRIAIPLGMALGLAVGVKLDALAIAGAVLVGAIVLAPAADRVRVGLGVLIPAGVVGGFWYVRDFVQVGNPVPGLNLGIFPKVKAPLDQVGGFSILHYAANTTVIHKYFMFGLKLDFGTAYPLWMLVCAVGAVAVVIWSPTTAYRVAAITAIVAIAAYVITPTSAFGAPGAPTLFTYNVRYAMVGLVLGAALVPVIPQLSDRRTGYWVLGLSGVLAVLVLWNSHTWPIPPDLSVSWERLGVGLSVAAVVLVLLLSLAPRVTFAGLGVVVGVASLVLGAFVQTRWIKREYQHVARLSPALAWGRTIHHARIAFDGLGLNYPLTGSDNSNYADYLSTGGPQHQRQEITDCRTLRRELDAGRYTYVVFTGSYSTGSLGAVNIGNLGNLAQHDAWVRGAPQAVPVLTTPVATAYRLTGALDPAGCPS